MAARSRSLSGAKSLDQMISELTCNVEQAGLSGGATLGNARFDQMTSTIHFVIGDEIRPTLGWLVELIVGIEITIGQLHGAQQIDRLIGNGREFRIRCPTQF